MDKQRELMKAHFKDLALSDQQKQLPQPPLEQPYPADALIVELPEVDAGVMTKRDIFDCIKERRSRRRFSQAPLNQNELSLLLWVTQGVQRIFGKNYATYRPVPSGGARHPFETYLAVNRVSGLEPGVYRYLALSHRLMLLYTSDCLAERITHITLGQDFAGTAAALFIWSCVPYRGEWRYGDAAHKTMLLDAGHLCQNLYLVSEALNCGTCALAAYDQDLANQFISADGKEEFVIYMAPVGKVGR